VGGPPLASSLAEESEFHRLRNAFPSPAPGPDGPVRPSPKSVGQPGIWRGQAQRSVRLDSCVRHGGVRVRGSHGIGRTATKEDLP
jgi:hypothetical protein